MEFILQVEDKPFVNGAKKLYKSTAFESLVFDQKGLNKLEKYDRAKHKAEKKKIAELRAVATSYRGIGYNEGYNAGLTNLHDALKTVSEMSYDERMAAFGKTSISDILTMCTPPFILNAVTEFKSAKERKNYEYKLLCEVEGNVSKRKAIVYAISGNDLSVLYLEPAFNTKFVKNIWKKNVCKPTGKVYSDLLEFVEDADEEGN